MVIHINSSQSNNSLLIPSNYSAIAERSHSRSQGWSEPWYPNTTKAFPTDTTQPLCPSLPGSSPSAFGLSSFIPVTKSHQAPAFTTQFYGWLCLAHSWFSPWEVPGPSLSGICVQAHVWRGHGTCSQSLIYLHFPRHGMCRHIFANAFNQSTVHTQGQQEQQPLLSGNCRSFVSNYFLTHKFMRYSPHQSAQAP